MKNFWARQSVGIKTFIVFLVASAVAIPLFILASVVVQPQYWLIIESSAIGWFAGGAIVGTYILYSKR